MLNLLNRLKSPEPLTQFLQDFGQKVLELLRKGGDTAHSPALVPTALPTLGTKEGREKSH